MRTKSDLAVVVALVAAWSYAAHVGCATSPERQAFTTIAAATSAVEGALVLFNQGYQAGKYTEADREKCKVAYEAFIEVRKLAIDLARGGTDPMAVIDAAAKTALEVIEGFTKKGS